jgi:hypothetical protein
MCIKGIICYFTVTKPNKKEWESSPLENRIALSHKSPTWDLLRVIPSIRGAMMDHTGNIITTNKKR